MQHYHRLRDLREDSDLTQQKLCEKLYINKTTYVNYEQGKRCIPFDLAVTLADFYQVSLDYLAGRTNIKEKFENDRTKKFISENKKPEESFNDEEVQIIRQYRLLTERSKGRVEQLIEMLLENQKK